MVIVASYKEVIIGVYSDINRAKRVAKETFPHAHNKVKYTPFEIDDKKETNDKAISEAKAGGTVRSKSELKRIAAQRDLAEIARWTHIHGDVS